MSRFRLDDRGVLLHTAPIAKVFDHRLTWYHCRAGHVQQWGGCRSGVTCTRTGVSGLRDCNEPVRLLPDWAKAAIALGAYEPLPWQADDE